MNPVRPRRGRALHDLDLQAPVIVEQMARTIGTLKAEGLTVLLSEQNLHFAKAVADRALIIESGAIRYDGTFEELEAQPEIGDRYLSV